VPQYDQWFITLAPQYLAKGRNTVTVSYARLHSTNGEGLHRMVDPVDGKVYTYAHFEPAAAHQMFALFDQPDLKATGQVSVSVPPDWQVVSTARARARCRMPAHPGAGYSRRRKNSAPRIFRCTRENAGAASRHAQSEGIARHQRPALDKAAGPVSMRAYRAT
jgi:hypothetical protein